MNVDECPPELAGSHRAWMDAVNDTDLDAYAEMVSEDVVWLPPGQEALEGRDAFRRWLAPFFEQYGYEFTIGDAAIRVAGRWAVEKARFRSVMTPSTGGDHMEHVGRCIVLWREDEDGSWRIDRYVDDSLPPAGQSG